MRGSMGERSSRSGIVAEQSAGPEQLSSASTGLSWPRLVAVITAMAVACVPMAVGAGVATAADRGAGHPVAVSSVQSASPRIARATDFSAVDPASGWATVTGRVIGSDGKPLPAGATGSVVFSDSAGRPVPGFSSDSYGGSTAVELAAGGTWGVTGLGAGDYTVAVENLRDAAGNPIGGQYDGLATHAARAGTLHADLGKVTTGVDLMTPTKAATISGRVTGPNGAALPAGTTSRVNVMDTQGFDVAFVDIAAGGQFTIGGLAPGDYYLSFSASPANNAPSPWATTWLGGAWRIQDAKTVHVAPGAAVTNVNGAMLRGAIIRGRLTGPGGAPLAVNSWPEVDALGDSTHNAWMSGEVAADGSFFVDRLPPGSYALRFDSDGYAGVWLGGSATSAGAQKVVIRPGVDVGGLSVALDPEGVVTGSIAGPGGIPLANNSVLAVEALRPDGSIAAGDSNIDALSGGPTTYRLGGLAPGDYKIRFTQQQQGVGPVFGPAWIGGASSEQATLVHVVSGAHLTGVDGRFNGAGASITGTVTEPGGGPLQTGPDGDRSVTAIPVGERQAARWTSIAADGKFSLAGLGPGDYHVSFSAANHAPQWWHGSMSRVGATVVHVGGNGTTTSLAVQLPVARMLKGRVTGPAGAALAAGSHGKVVAFDSSGRQAGASDYRADGAYAIGDLPSGAYKLRYFSDDYRYRSRWAGGALSAAGSPVVTVANSSAPTVRNESLASTSPPPPVVKVPSVPRALRLASSPARGRANVAWLAPATNGGAPVLRYLVRVSLPNAATRFGAWQANASTVKLLTGLRKGASYRVQVMAVNRVGNSPAATLNFRQPR